jgi:hypothetical protein
MQFKVAMAFLRLWSRFFLPGISLITVISEWKEKSGEFFLRVTAGSKRFHA